MKNNVWGYRYYREFLSEKEKIAYDTIVLGLLNYLNSICVTGVQSNRINEIYNAIRKDNPQLFFVNDIKYQYNPLFNHGLVLPTYRFDKTKTNATFRAINATIRYIKNFCVNKNQLQQEIIIHDYLCKSVLYDLTYRESSYECVGPLVFKKGVCDGISKAGKLLFDSLGIECIIVHGKSESRMNYVTNDSSHAWNIVKINNHYYHLDITFDLSVISYGVLRYDYFNLSDSYIMLDHLYDNTLFPKCDTHNDYYFSKSMVVNNINELVRYVSEGIRRGNQDIVVKALFHVDDKLIEKSVTKSINNSNRIFRNNYTRFQIVSNVDQNVYHIHFI